MMAGRSQAAKESERTNLDRVRPGAVKVQLSERPLDEPSVLSHQNRRGTAERLLDRRVVEERTSLDITTIYRRMKAGSFPQPVRVGRRRVAWRESDIAEWQDRLEVGVRKG
jgi:prophage regulatory protein